MASILKNVYIDKLHDVVNKYNNTYYSAIKMKSVDVKSRKFVDFGKIIMIKTPNLSLVTT